MTRPSPLTGHDNYFEDFVVGTSFRHARGKTITHLENVLITHLVMNTAQAHFNEHEMKGTPLGGVVSFGGVQLSIVLGLSSQDCCENAVSEVSLTNVRFIRPVVHGTTLYAATEVIAKDELGQPDVGIVTFRHFGLSDSNEVILKVDRRVILRRRVPGIST